MSTVYIVYFTSGRDKYEYNTDIIGVYHNKETAIIKTMENLILVMLVE
jgi:hypothetical protein